MRKRYAGLFVAVMLLVIVCCVYGSGISTVRKDNATSETQTENSEQIAFDDLGTVTIEDEQVPVVDTITSETANVSGSILFIMSALLLMVIIAVIVIIATVAASTTVMKF